MLERLASGGLFTVFVIALIAAGYARVFRAKRPVYLGIFGLSAFTILGSQFLPDAYIFRIRIHDSLVFWGWALVWSSPVMAYASLIWLARRHTRRKNNGTE